VTYFGGYLDIPFSFEKGFGDVAAFGAGARTLKERMTQKVVRDRHIVSLAGAATDPAYIEVVNDDMMIFVNQDNSEGAIQDGTYENPYANFTDAQGDERWVDPEEGEDPTWVYVFSWDATPDIFNDGEDTPVVLAEQMVFWGQGYAQYRFGGTNGVSDPDMNPILDGDGDGYVVELADNNEVMGFDITGGEHGIYGNSILNTNIHDNVIWDNTYGVPDSGIHIENYFYGPDISGETLTYTIADNEIYDNYGDGIFLRHTIYGDVDDSLAGLTLNNMISGNAIYDNGEGENLNAVDVANFVIGFDSISGNTFNNTFKSVVVFIGASGSLSNSRIRRKT